MGRLGGVCLGTCRGSPSGAMGLQGPQAPYNPLGSTHVKEAQRIHPTCRAFGAPGRSGAGHANGLRSERPWYLQCPPELGGCSFPSCVVLLVFCFKLYLLT